VRRGLSSTVVMLVFLAILTSLVVPLLLQLQSSYVTRLLEGLPEAGVGAARLSAHAVTGELGGVANYSVSDGVVENLTIVVRNWSGREVPVEAVLAYVTCGGTSRLLALERSISLSPRSELWRFYTREVLSGFCPDMISVDAVYLLTSEGAVVPLNVVKPAVVALPPPTGGERREAGLARAVELIPLPVKPSDTVWSPLSLLGKYFTVATLDSASNPTRVDSSTPLMRGSWTLSRELSGVTIAVENQRVYNVWLGYDPLNSSRYNIMISARGISLRFGGTSEAPCGTSQYVRVLVYGFTSEDSRGILSLGGRWVKSPSNNVANYTFLDSQRRDTLYLRGRAERVLVYCRAPGSTTGYEPYVMLLATSPRSGAGVLFTTIDRTYGFYNSRNDYTAELLDSSLRPLALVYRALPISNKNYTAVSITLNYRFHDNEGSDALGTSVDLPVIFVGLVDEFGNVYSYRSYNFRELTRYEDTYPPVAQAQSSVVFIPLPPSDTGERTFYVFIAFQDPYFYSVNNVYLDDLDFTLLIESFTVILFT